MPTIHPTAIVDPAAQLADDVEVGPYCIIESDVTIGAGTVLRPHVIIRRYTSMGQHNVVDSFTALGGDPQDHKFDSSQVSHLKIGDHNVFRECVTINRATGAGNATVVGNHTYWMSTSHAGHNCVVEDHVIMPSSSLLGGHVTVGRGAILPGSGAIHQFVWIGEGSMFQGGTRLGMHLPPFCIAARVNQVVGLNTVGLRRNPAISDEDRRQLKEAFKILYLSGLTTSRALERMDACTDWGEVADRFREFVRKVLAAEKPFNRGLCPYIPQSQLASRAKTMSPDANAV